MMILIIIDVAPPTCSCGGRSVEGTPGEAGTIDGHCLIPRELAQHII